MALPSLLAGLAVMAVAQVAAPLGSPPLYDGVIVQEPYRYLVPASGQVGSPRSFQTSLAAQGATSPRFAAATSESPPQAQLIADLGAFVVRAGVRTVAVSIEPIEAEQPPADGSIAGNVYRFVVADESGTPLAINQATPPTVILRAPDGTLTASIARFSGGTWQMLATEPTGEPGIFDANTTVLGDFAIIIPKPAGPFGLDQGAVAAVAGAVLSVAALGFLIFRRRNSPAAARVPSSERRPRPSKRKRKARRGGGSR